MDKKIFVTAKDVASIMSISLGHAYKLIRSMNLELKNDGFIVVAGKVPYSFFKKKIYGLDSGE